MRAGKHNAKMSKEAARKAQAELDQNPPVPDDPDFVFSREVSRAGGFGFIGDRYGDETWLVRQ